MLSILKTLLSKLLLLGIIAGYYYLFLELKFKKNKEAERYLNKIKS